MEHQIEELPREVLYPSQGAMPPVYGTSYPMSARRFLPHVSTAALPPCQDKLFLFPVEPRCNLGQKPHQPLPRSTALRRIASTLANLLTQSCPEPTVRRGTHDSSGSPGPSPEAHKRRSCYAISRKVVGNKMPTPPHLPQTLSPQVPNGEG